MGLDSQGSYEKVKGRRTCQASQAVSRVWNLKLHTVGALIMFADWRKGVRHFQFGNKGTELSTQQALDKYFLC